MPIPAQQTHEPQVARPNTKCPRCRNITHGESTICNNCGFDRNGSWPAHDKMCGAGTTINLSRAEYRRARVCVAACDGVPEAALEPGFVQRQHQAQINTITRLRAALRAAQHHIAGEALPAKKEALAIIKSALDE